MSEAITYIVENLADAREALSQIDAPVILTNKTGSTRYMGMLVIDYTFKKLTTEFPQIIKIIVDVGNDNSALFTAIKLNYQNIIYTGNSTLVKKLVPLPLP